MPEPRFVRRLSDDKTVDYDPGGNRRRARAAASRAISMPPLRMDEVAPGYVTLHFTTVPLTEHIYRQLDKKPFPYNGSIALAVVEIDGKRESLATFHGKPVRVLGVAQSARLPRLIFPEVTK